ncbi:hypothetical protein HBI56_193990 [Parastagonospora nodorum]|uniref:2EXR domain-containing protein n=1 Tax=Phaeosphaeria nodorum (strain SN15 / ATCC MYA-4574 / FGSC 10173) TaxID=321614 RepID=A0A7U2HY78_PHANO|nr:hypothetical protein HBH56_205640 [Parastagonospora nodorum]QRC94769.1 hypothetical protein JI435_149130 [Parastagonospora nodorum SN15]KAH3923737.1 hypothetical protein HBH54_204510 [Parastagonospora nodorum]KAH3942310.1 hypothetical protein HBH53_189840 [Parastagonospora nodorum]KAH3962352.1 hypothetical protein HBH51_175940 [Parastagonospora nodorum]
MSPSIFHPFTHLPPELQDLIWQHSMPVTTTLHIREGADLDITSISPPPAQALASKASRAVYLSQCYASYSIYTTEDWAQIAVNDKSTIQLVITPAENPKANLNITWTELQVVLHDALPVVQRLHIVCSKPERLVRLWMAPEAGLVGLGKSHWDEEVFGREGVVSDRDYRESLRADLSLTSSAATLEELEVGSGEVVEERGLVEERVVEGFGVEARFSSTKVFTLDCEELHRDVEKWEEMVIGDSGVAAGAEPLTEKAIERFIRETGWVPKNSTPSSEYSVEVEYDGELWLTVD